MKYLIIDKKSQVSDAKPYVIKKTRRGIGIKKVYPMILSTMTKSNTSILMVKQR